MLAQITDLRLCALMSLSSYVFALYVLRPSVCARMSQIVQHWAFLKVAMRFLN